jgi:hypothetical protein
VVTLLFINISMAHRKNIEFLLEKDCEFWGDPVELHLVDVDCSSYAWHVICQNTAYEITYSDIGEITLSALPSKYWPGSTVRELYHGDASETSYKRMIDILSDNFVDIV